MGITEQLNPAVIFAILAILFAALNFILWSLVWKIIQSKEKIAGGASSSADEEKFKELIRALKAVDRKNDKLEDQLWGVLDKLKEIEKQLDGFDETIRESGSLQVNDKNIKVIKNGTKKIFSLVKKERSQLENFRDDVKKISAISSDIEILREIFTTLNSNVAKLNSYLKNMEK
ncbi:MAG: hypothetical protein ACQEQC_02200 [Elusimicrobiota bacterium]